MLPNEFAVLMIIKEKCALDLEQLQQANDVVEENLLIAGSLCRQGYLERKRLGGLQVTRKGKTAINKVLCNN